MSYFSADVFEGEIINALIEKGFIINRFDEHPSWTNENVLGEFTIIAKKS